MRVYLPRFFVRGLAANLNQLELDLEQAAGLGCQMAVFPEQFLTGYHGEDDLPRIKQALGAASARHAGMLIVFGTITEEGRNRQYAYLGGAVRAYYDKVHLFLPTGEGELWEPGARYVAYTHGEWRIGMCTCNDLRFPEQPRALKLAHDINLLVYPALWPWHRDGTFAALLRARAIENGAFCIGCCVAGVDNGAERFDGAGNHVFDPLGRELDGQGRVYELDPARFAEVLVDTRAQYREIESVELY
jgi:omega-amidase